jgi:hypothetical protein
LRWYRGRLNDDGKRANCQRTISLPVELGQRLWDQGADLNRPMFAGRSGERLRARNMTQVLGKAVEKATLPNVCRDSFRQTHGSSRLEQGWPLTDVADRLGRRRADGR